MVQLRIYGSTHHVHHRRRWLCPLTKLNTCASMETSPSEPWATASSMSCCLHRTHNAAFSRPDRYLRSVIFKDVRFDTFLNFGFFWAASFTRCFFSIVNFGHFGAPSLVTLFTFQNVIDPEPLNTKTPKHHNTKTGMSCVFVKTSLATFSPKNTDYIVCPAPSVFLCYFLSVFLGFPLFFVFFVFFCSSFPGAGSPSALPPPWSLTLWKVKSEGRLKNGQNSLWRKNIEKTRRANNGKNSIWSETGQL